MQKLIPTALLLVAVSTNADSLADLKASLARLGGKETVAATLDVTRSRHAKGRFLTQDFDGTVTFDAEMTPDGVRLSLPRTLIDRANDEEWSAELNSSRTAPTAQALEEVVPQTVERALDFSRPLLRLVARGTVAQERSETLDGRPVRVVVLRLPKRSSGEHSAGSFAITEDTLTIWLAADGTPLRSARVRKGSAGFLFLKIEMLRTETTTYAVRADHLVTARAEDSAVINGPGSQTGTARSIWAVR